jgi:Na+/H+-translocating membrane pyrophosphatase
LELLFSKLHHSYVFSKDDGTPEMRAVSDPIREGAEGFLKVQYGAIFKMAFALGTLILLSYSLRPQNQNHTGGVESLGSVMLGIISCIAFAIGAGCSAAAGYVSMWVSASSNIRVASAARRSYHECLEVCFRGGAFSAVLCITLCVFGVSMLYIVLSVLFVNSGVLKPHGMLFFSNSFIYI